MDGFAKVFASLWTGTLYGRSDPQHVFIFLLCHEDAKGFVDVSPAAIAGATGLPLERVTAALLELEAPDPMSRSSLEEGRRIVRLDEHRPWGWRIVNHAGYRAKRDPEQRREQNREAKRRQRQSATVSHGQPLAAQAEAEAEAEAVEPKHLSADADDTETPTGSNSNGKAHRKPRREKEPEGFREFYSAYPRHEKPRAAAKAYAAARKRHPDLDHEDFVNAGSAYGKRCYAEGREDRFILHPASWLNADAFLEEFADEHQAP